MATALRVKDFQPGKPIALALAAIEPREAPDNGFGRAYVFKTSEGPLYLDAESTNQVEEGLRLLNIQPGEQIRIGRPQHRLSRRPLPRRPRLLPRRAPRSRA